MRLHPSQAAVLLACTLTPLTAPAAPPTSAVQEDGEESLTEAQELLREAEEELRKKHYRRAIRIYEKLAEDHPETAEGKIGKERSQPTAYLGWSEILRQGPSANRVDVVVMGDGYEGTDKDQRAFDSIAESLPGRFESEDVFGEYYGYFNFLRASLASKDDNLDNYGREYETALQAWFEQGAEGQPTVHVDLEQVSDVLAEVPGQDGLAIAVVRKGISGSGAPGVAIIGGRGENTDYTEGRLFHVWGHAFAGLGDEYSVQASGRGPTQIAPNVSTTPNEDQVPWKHWLEENVAGIGVYEGADGKVHGAWKPTNHCLMATGGKYCEVCREALVLEIHRYVDPIDGCVPPAIPLKSAGGAIEPIVAEDTLELEVQVMTPEEHGIEVSWWVLPDSEVPAEPTSLVPEAGENDRRSRGPLTPIGRDPDEHSRGSRRGDHSFRFRPSRYDPGTYRIVCRAKDPARLRGDRHSWVLKDEHGLLESERGWWVVVP